jgi:sec-independent protein translocase protein TatA
MGLGGLHIWHLLILLVIIFMVFGTKKLKTFGEDLGGAINGFKKAMDDGKNAANANNSANKEQDKISSGSGQTVDVKPEKVDADR